jgi:Lar family restriction alleviation protein
VTYNDGINEDNEKQPTVASPIKPLVMLPCPFCGGGVKLERYSSDRGRDASKVECYSCDFTVIKNSKVETINAWNKRAI